jgi:hypothetical protein
MTRLVSNAKAKVQRREVHGRQYLVAPITILAPGVLNGSKGALYYPPDEIARDHEAWNGIPILINHSTRDGAAVSARCPDVLASQEVGRVFNSRITKQGRQVVDGWFDADALKRVSAGVYDKLMRGTPVSVSTGLFTENEVAEGRDHKGRSYSYVARAYRPDHLAVLPDQPGACSIEDGCGVLLNRATQNASESGYGPGENPASHEHHGGVSAGDLFSKTSMDTPTALKNVRALIKGKNYAQKTEIAGYFAGKAKSSPDKKSRDHYDKLAREVRTRVNTNNVGGRDMPLTQERKKAVVDGLISNCDCGWSEEDRETLNGFADERLLKMDEYRKKAIRDGELVANAEKALAEGEVCNEDDQECLDKQKMMGDKKKPPFMAQNAEEWLETAPPAIRSAVENAMAIEAREKQELIDALIADVADKGPVTNVLKTKTLDELRTLQALAPKRATANWAGSAGSRSVYNAPAKVEPLKSPDAYAQTN